MVRVIDIKIEVTLLFIMLHSPLLVLSEAF